MEVGSKQQVALTEAVFGLPSQWKFRRRGKASVAHREAGCFWCYKADPGTRRDREIADAAVAEPLARRSSPELAVVLRGGRTVGRHQ